MNALHPHVRKTVSMHGFIDAPNLLRQSQQTATPFASRRTEAEAGITYAHYALIRGQLISLGKPALQCFRSQNATTYGLSRPDLDLLLLGGLGDKEKTAYPLSQFFNPLSLEGLVEEFPGSRSISSFGNEPYEILKTIPVTFRKGDPSGVVACFEQANISMVGETWLDAFKALQAAILNTLEDCMEHKDHLGPSPQKQLAVLRAYIKNKKRIAKQ